MLPDEVKTPLDYLEYLLTINQIPEEMKVKFRSGFKALEHEARKSIENYKDNKKEID